MQELSIIHMNIQLGSPLSLLCLVVLVPLLVSCGVVRRRQVAAARGLRLMPQARSGAAATTAALALAAGLIALAAARPAVSVQHPQYVRTHAETYVVVDTSVSMLARPDRVAASRIDRARALVSDLARRLPDDVPVGLVAMPQGLLPLLAPTVDRDALENVAESNLLVGSVPTRPIWLQEETDPSGPGLPVSRVSTSIEALGTLGLGAFFAPLSKRRVAVVVTDAETSAFNVATVRALLTRENIKLVAVRVGAPSDRLWRAKNGKQVLDRNYAPLLDGVDDLAGLASSLGGRLYRENEVAAVAERVSALVVDGPRRKIGLRHDEIAIGPYVALASLPVALVALAPLLPLYAGRRLRSRRVGTFQATPSG